MKSLNVAFQIKATEENFPLIPLHYAIGIVVLTLNLATLLSRAYWASCIFKFQIVTISSLCYSGVSDCIPSGQFL